MKLGAEIRSSDSDLLYSCRRLFYRVILWFWLKYEAWIANFCILAAIDRFSWISWKVESRWGKSKSRWTVEENQILSKENFWVLSRKIWGLVLTPNFLLCARMDLFDWFFSFSTAHNFNFGFSNVGTLTSPFDTKGTPSIELPYLHSTGYELKASDARRFDTRFCRCKA